MVNTKASNNPKWARYAVAFIAAVLALEFEQGLPAASIGEPVSQTVEGFVQSRVENRLRPSLKNLASPIAETILMESARHRLDPLLVLAVVERESQFSPWTVGKHGEIGLMQIRPATAEWIVRKMKLAIPIAGWGALETLRDPVMNIRIGSAYLAYLRDHFDARESRFLAAYNMGAGGVTKLLKNQIQPRVYPEQVRMNFQGYQREIVRSGAEYLMQRNLASTESL